ncbi:MAG TPA: hypothetical protein VNI02_16820, partial [Blastocatellia bacterium]|nr:hypothetical protein [Blastocatellia bacterium]
MKSNSGPARRSTRLRFPFLLALLSGFIFIFTTASLLPGGRSSSSPRALAAGNNCATATVINPSSLTFTEESTTAGAGNDIDPGFTGCAPGQGADVVYSFTPAVTDTYT